MNFEKAVFRLDEIIKALESGDISLENSVALYQEGVKLLTDCKQEINNAELMVTVADNSKDDFDS